MGSISWECAFMSEYPGTQNRWTVPSGGVSRGRVCHQPRRLVCLFFAIKILSKINQKGHSYVCQFVVAINHSYLLLPPKSVQWAEAVTLVSQDAQENQVLHFFPWGLLPMFCVTVNLGKFEIKNDFKLHSQFVLFFICSGTIPKSSRPITFFLSIYINTSILWVWLNQIWFCCLFWSDWITRGVSDKGPSRRLRPQTDKGETVLCCYVCCTALH